MKYSVLIVGLGNISLLYDLHSSHDSYLTHTKSFLHHDKYNLVGGVDPLVDKREAFEKSANAPGYESIQDIAEQQIDVIVIATPASVRINIINETLKFGPKLYLIEKPLATTLDEGGDILNVCKNNSVDIFVNYIRRVDPSTEEIKKLVSDGSLGGFIKGNVIYNRGLLNCGSHAIDWLIDVFGGPLNIAGISIKRKIEQLNNEYEIDFLINFAQGQVVFQSLVVHNFNILDIALYFTKGVIKITNSGRKIEVLELEHKQNSEEYNSLVPRKRCINSGLNRYQLNVTNHILDFLRNKKKLKSDGNTAYSTLKTCLEILG